MNAKLSFQNLTDTNNLSYDTRISNVLIFSDLPSLIEFVFCNEKDSKILSLFPAIVYCI